MADVTKTVAILFKGEDQTSDALRGVERAIDGIGAGANKIGEAGREIDKLGASGGVARGILAELASAVSVGLLVKGFIDANVEVERFVKGVTAIKGSGEAANTELEYLRATSDRLGLAVRDTSGAYVGLLASVKNTPLEGEPARRIFESISGAMGQLGKSSADTEGALLAIQQMISKGKVSAEELRGQLGERLPGAFKLFADSMGVPTATLNDLLEAGAVGIDRLPKFAEAVASAFGGSGQVDGYSASLNRLQNALDAVFVAVGKAGAFEALTNAIKGATGGVDIAGRALERLGLIVGATFNVLRGGSIDVFKIEMERLKDSVEQGNAKAFLPLNETLAEHQRLLRQNSDAAQTLGKSYDEIETAKFVRQAGALTDQLKEEAAALKILKVNRDEANRSTQDYANMLVTIGKTQRVTDAEFLKGVEEASKHIRNGTNDVVVLKDALSNADVVGTRSADALAKAFKLVNDGAAAAAKKGDAYTDSLKKQAEQAKKAEEAQERLRLEMEKLASNERIKLIEARVQLNVAEVQEQTKRIQAAFESLDNTVNSTADVINKAFGLLAGNGTLIDSSVRNRLFEQLDRENANRERAMKMQEELTQAQIDVLRQQARQLERGDALIKVDGGGLAPHLEAFMWEILKAVQIRTNRDGLRLLLGVT